MRFESVYAHAFGPLSNQELQFAPGMTVFFAPNEGGKSSWHSAIFAGLCGTRRGAGVKKEDREFAERHKPWDGLAWKVSAVVRLDSGRLIELSHDLAGRVACQAKDALTGSDCSADIMNEGNPDGSKWIGLDRRSFLLTACVKQGEVRALHDDPGLLQGYLQRAAAAPGGASTAAGALKSLEAFQSQRVGKNQANSTRPLRRAVERLDAAQSALSIARREHQGYVELAQRVEELERRAEEAELELLLVRAKRASEDAEVAVEKLKRAQELRERYPAGRPADIASDDHLALKVAVALDAWHNRSEAPEAGQTVPELRRKLEELGAGPTTGSSRVQKGSDRRTWVIAVVALLAVLVGLISIGVDIRVPVLLLTGATVLAWAFSRTGPSGRITDTLGLEDHRRSLEEQVRLAEQAQQKRSEAETTLREVAHECGLAEGETQDLEQELEDWQRQREEHLGIAAQGVEEWAELQAILAGKTLASLQIETEALRAHSKELVHGLGDGKLENVVLKEDVNSQLRDLEAATKQEQMGAQQALGKLSSCNPPSVPEAEEEVVAAEAEVGRVRRLENVLENTRIFVRSAQANVHRNIAPALAESMRPWLSDVTSGRYVDVRIDPPDLSVEVRGVTSPWREVVRLSHGTIDQIYLLLRLAIVEYLGASSESCPLILDDVTVLSDAIRSEALLHTLQLISRSRQVILFSQEPEVLAWADRSLREPQDKFIRLDPNLIPV